MYMYVNGAYVEEKTATISPFDHGFLYGLGLFETIRTYSGHPFLLDNHLDRLNSGLREVQITHQFQRADVYEIITHLSELNGLRDSYIRFNVAAGLGKIGLQTEPYEHPTVIMFQKRLPMSEFLVEKEAVILQLPRNTPETRFRLKSHHFFNNVAAKREIGPDPRKEGIFLTNEGYLAEGVTSNLFWIKDHCLFTPSLETGILNGITRQYILTIAPHLQLHVKEGKYVAEELAEADEIFFTNSIQGITPVIQWENRIYPGTRGYWVQQLNKIYQRDVDSLWNIHDISN